MVRACAGKDLPKGDPAKTYLLRTVGNQAHEVLDVTDPSTDAGEHRDRWPHEHPQELVGV